MHFLFGHTQETIPNIIRDFPEWHRGRQEYGVWIIALGQDEMLDKVEAARGHLSEFLVSSYRRQPHITLFVPGFLTDRPRFTDDYFQFQLDEHLRLLSEAMITPFSIEIGGLNSFASAPFFEVKDREGGIERIRALLLSLKTDVDCKTFTPHVTVGLYAGAFSTNVVAERLAGFSSNPVTLLVDQVTLAAYSASEIDGPLSYKQHVVLSRK